MGIARSRPRAAVRILTFRGGSAAGPRRVLPRASQPFAGTFGFLIARRQAIELFRFNIGNFCEHRFKLAAARAFRTRCEVFFGHQCRHFFSDCRRNQLIDRHTFLLGEFAKLPVKRLWQTETERSHGYPPQSFCKNAAGVNTSIPKRSTPKKSRVLCVTILSQPDATANSNTRSSPESRRKGRHKKNISCQVAISQR